MSSSADFLCVTLERLGKIVVIYVADIALVNHHTKCNGCDNDVFHLWHCCDCECHHTLQFHLCILVKFLQSQVIRSEGISEIRCASSIAKREIEID